MKRTQIYLPQSTIRLVKTASAKQGITMSELIRIALDEKLNPPASSVKRYSTFAESLRKVAKLKQSGPKDLADNVDTYLYS